MPTDIPNGAFEARYLAFLETVTHIRTKLHRYCSRMTGSVLDGEDISQDALFEAYRKIEQFDPTRPLAPWLFGIAHNRCIDFLRHSEMEQGAEDQLFTTEATMPMEPSVEIGAAAERLVLALPPRERACVLLKDVFDYSLEEIAELVGSSVGGVKAALNRGRSKLSTSPVSAKPPPSRAAGETTIPSPSTAADHVAGSPFTASRPFKTRSWVQVRLRLSLAPTEPVRY